MDQGALQRRFLADPRLRIVLPTEVAADSWRRWLVGQTAMGVIRSDRVMSWDRFKASLLPQSGRRAVNMILRRLFAQQLLERNRREPLLQRLVPPKFREYPTIYEAMVATAVRRLDWLRRPRNMLRLRPAWRGDVERLYEEYNGWLQRYGLFEPDWELAGALEQMEMPEAQQEQARLLSAVSRTVSRCRFDAGAAAADVGY